MKLLLDVITNWLGIYGIKSIGVIIFVIGFVLFVSELIVYIKHDATPEQLIMWALVSLSGLLTFLFDDIVLGLLTGLSALMIYETYELRDAPVWGKLMLATTMGYLTILLGKMGQEIFDVITHNTGGDERIFATAFNIAFLVFLLFAFAFFGKKFILVSRFSSPEIVYLFLFGIVYAFIARTKLRNFDYLNFGGSLGFIDPSRVLFLTFGIYEMLVFVMFFMYLISGWLLGILFGVSDVTDQHVLDSVNEVARHMGVKGQIKKIGFVKAPILNAFAYGPWFDKRVAFISDDLDEFTDSDIRGIVGHELAHATRHHVLILLLVSVFEVALKKALHLPATQIDYSFFTDGLGISFAQYFVFSYGLAIILYIIVRALEGHADLVTKRMGYGKDLSQALFRLEGFYQGVASDFGISVNLLTDKKYTSAEKERFAADAARRLYQEILQPTRGAALSNILLSHPRTSYRITALLRDDISPIKSAFLPYRLLGLYKRKAALKQIQSIRKQAKKLIDATYIQDFGEEAMQRVHEDEPIYTVYEYLLNKTIVAFDAISGTYFKGKVEKIEKSSEATTPLYFILVDGTRVNPYEYTVKLYNPNEKYILKNGEIFTLIDIVPKENDKELAFSGTIKEKSTTLTISNLGIPQAFLEELIGTKVYFHYNGNANLGNLTSIEWDSSWQRSSVTLTDGKGENHSLKGAKLSVAFSPIGVEFRREKRPEDFEILNHLKKKNVALYSKDNYDVPEMGKITNTTDTSVQLENRDGEHSLELLKVDYVVSYEKTVEIIRYDQLSWFTKFSFWFANRKKFSVIRP